MIVVVLRVRIYSVLAEGLVGGVGGRVIFCSGLILGILWTIGGIFGFISYIFIFPYFYIYIVYFSFSFTFFSINIFIKYILLKH